MRVSAAILDAIARAEREGRVVSSKRSAMPKTAPRTAGTLVSIDLPIPPSVNNLYKNVPGKGRVRSKNYKRWQRAAYPLIAQMKRPEVFPVSVLIVVSGKVNMRRDVDNFAKAITDAMVNCGILPGDSLRYVNDNRQRYVGGDGEAKAEVFIFERAA
jgi:crossover junction endodeoxyribonuclease RusA